MTASWKSNALPSGDTPEVEDVSALLPKDFCARMEAMLGVDYPAFLASYGKPRHPSLRINPLKLNPESDDLRALMPFLGDPVPWVTGGYYYDADGGVRPGKHPLHEAGLYYIQEASAMIPASLCPPVPGEKVLDLCAAPGGKATQLSGALQGQGLLIANEINPARAAILSQNIERSGIVNAVVTNETPAALSARFPGFFDRIVVDAPCSGEGMFRKEEQAITMWSRENVNLCAARQRDILTEAMKMLAPGGYLTYSTCTFAPEENEGTLLWLLVTYPELSVVEPQNPRLLACLASSLCDRGNPDWVPEAMRGDLTADRSEQIKKSIRLFPHHADGEGHFAVLLRKAADAPAVCKHHADGSDRGGSNEKSAYPDRSGTGSRKSSVRSADRSGGKSGGKGRAEVSPLTRALAVFDAFAQEVIGHSLPDGVPCLFGDTLYQLPTACGTDGSTLDRLRVLRAGLQLGTIKGDRFEPSHALALSLEPDSVAHTFALDLTTDQPAAYLRGEVIPCPADLRGWYLMTYSGHPLGWGKASGGQMKNHYPKGLRK